MRLYEEKRPVVMEDDAIYDLVTVKRARGGVVKRETKRGADISVKTQFEVKGGDFLISKRQIVHGACGLVPAILNGSTVSNEYSVLRGLGTIDLEFLKYLSHSVYFQQTCFHSSIGVHIEKMIFKLEKWLQWEFNIPPLAEQARIVNVLSTWDRAAATIERLIALSERQYAALSQKLCSGQRNSGPVSFKAFPLSDMAWIDNKALNSNTPEDYAFRYISLSDVTSRRVSPDLRTMRFQRRSVSRSSYSLQGRHIDVDSQAEFAVVCNDPRGKF